MTPSLERRGGPAQPRRDGERGRRGGGGQEATGREHETVWSMCANAVARQSRSSPALGVRGPSPPPRLAEGSASRRWAKQGCAALRHPSASRAPPRPAPASRMRANTSFACCLALALLALAPGETAAGRTLASLQRPRLACLRRCASCAGPLPTCPRPQRRERSPGATGRGRDLRPGGLLPAEPGQRQPVQRFGAGPVRQACQARPPGHHARGDAAAPGHMLLGKDRDLPAGPGPVPARPPDEAARRRHLRVLP